MGCGASKSRMGCGASKGMVVESEIVDLCKETRAKFLELRAQEVVQWLDEIIPVLEVQPVDEREALLGLRNVAQRILNGATPRSFLLSTAFATDFATAKQTIQSALKKEFQEETKEDVTLLQGCEVLWENKDATELRNAVDPGIAWYVLGYTLWTQDKAAEAADACQKAIHLLKGPLKTNAEMGLGVSFLHLGRYRDAEIIFRRCLRDDPTSARMLTNLGNVYFAQKKIQKATSFYLKALRIQKQSHADIAAVLNNLATALTTQGHTIHGRILYERALDIRSKTLTRDHPFVGESLANLGWAIHLQHDDDNAREFLLSAFDIYAVSLGAHHPRTQGTARNLALVEVLPPKNRLLPRDLLVLLVLFFAVVVCVFLILKA